MKRSVFMWVYDKTNGHVGGQVPNSKARICLLTTTGRRTRMAHTVPLVYLEDGNRLALAASGGMTRPPDWYLNVLANPAVTLDIDGDAVAMRARLATDEERAELWPRMVELYKGFAKAEARHDAEIAVVICTEDH
jgi:deazaflavin-dependent oxidoreductase (nitroreductase family)